MHYLLILYFWSHDHVARLDIHNESYEMCLASAEQLSKDIPTTWVCIPDSD